MNASSEPARGRMSVQYTVWCGVCEDWEYTFDEPTPTKFAVKIGWRYTKARGWVCPKCISTFKGAKKHEKVESGIWQGSDD
jgi:hypothetical protein